MVKASALYLVVVISLLIAIISGSLLTIAFYYRLEVKKKERLDRLLLNMDSGTSLILSKGFIDYNKDKVLDLFAEQTDSAVLRKEYWGIYDLGILKAFELKDTLKRSFLIANVFSDPNAIYLADEDRPLSISGKTELIGDGQLPKSGLKASYVDGKGYEGKSLITGTIKESARVLPPLNKNMLERIHQQFTLNQTFRTLPKDSIVNSFFYPVAIYPLDLNHSNLGRLKVHGKVILVSDTTVIINAETILDGVQIYARAIVIKDGFKGNCQLFAKDSIIIGNNCEFTYPSFAGVFKPEHSKVQAKIALGNQVSFSGLLLSYEPKRSDLQTMISFGKECKIAGEIFATGYVKLQKGLQVSGKTYAHRFIMQTPSTLYENYLIDISLNRKSLSPYYLSSGLFERINTNQQILRWLN